MKTRVSLKHFVTDYRFRVCSKNIPIGLHGVTAPFSHVDDTKDKERLPNILQFYLLNVLNLHQVLRPY